MAEALKRWTGSEWVTVAAVNRIETGGSSFAGFFELLEFEIIIGEPTPIT